LEPLTPRSPKIYGRRPGTGIRSTRIRKMRAMYLLEATVKGRTQSQMAEELGISRDTVNREIRRAVERGWDVEIRERLRQTLTDSPDIHREILNADPEKLSKLSRGYKLKLDAANALANGLGAFKQESHKVTETFSLSAIAAEAVAPPDGAVDVIDATPQRVAFQSEPVDGETIEEPKV
jgi:biotin operon repressor